MDWITLEQAINIRVMPVSLEQNVERRFRRQLDQL
jgi:hypothetical protein